ncbi:MAG: glycosyl hydrolase family 18 protein [Candidatus Dormibacteria bacterium]
MPHPIAAHHRRALPRAVLAGLLLIGGAAALAVARNQPPPPPPVVLLDGVQVHDGDRDLDPSASLDLLLPLGGRGGQWSARLDRRAVAVAGGGQRLKVNLPALPLGTWHQLAVMHQGLFAPARQALKLDFRTVDPLQMYMAWTVGAASTRVNIGWSRSPVSDAPIRDALRGTGATVARVDDHLSARWPPGIQPTVSLPAGLRAEGGAYLEQGFTAVAPPASGPAAVRVDLSGKAAPAVASLRLQAYYVPTDAAREDLRAHAHQISLLSPAFYSLAGDGNLVGRPDAEVLRICAEASVEVQPLVDNAGFDRAAGQQLLAASSRWDHVSDQLVAEARVRGYRGYQLDFENLAPGDRTALAAFSSHLGRRLHAAGLQLSAAVVPQKYFVGNPGLDSTLVPVITGTYDFPALSRDADWLSLMAYEQHTTATGPGPVAGIDWVEQVSRASSQGVEVSHLFLGVPLYFRDWTLGAQSSAGSWAEAAALASGSEGGVAWDFRSASAYFRYRDRDGADHALWFEEKSSLAAKVALARRLGFAGISAWRLGLEDPAFWEAWPGRP